MAINRFIFLCYNIIAGRGFGGCDRKVKIKINDFKNNRRNSGDCPWTLHALKNRMVFADDWEKRVGRETFWI